jgi:hypothetical protein
MHFEGESPTAVREEEFDRWFTLPEARCDARVRHRSGMSLEAAGQLLPVAVSEVRPDKAIQPIAAMVHSGVV